ncbi:hypothetical protein ACJX0J_007220, partial [Zea mays]
MLRLAREENDNELEMTGDTRILNVAHLYKGSPPFCKGVCLLEQCIFSGLLILQVMKDRILVPHKVHIAKPESCETLTDNVLNYMDIEIHLVVQTIVSGPSEMMNHAQTFGVIVWTSLRLVNIKESYFSGPSEMMNHAQTFGFNKEKCLMDDVKPGLFSCIQVAGRIILCPYVDIFFAQMNIIGYP